MIWHRLRGHRIEPFRVIDARSPWRWQCSCGHTFGGMYPVTADTCTRMRRGWYCTLAAGHSGPCPARPRWWNLTGRRLSRIGGAQ